MRMIMVSWYTLDPRKSTEDCKNLVHLAAQKKMTDEEFESIITKLDVKKKLVPKPNLIGQ